MTGNFKICLRVVESPKETLLLAAVAVSLPSYTTPGIHPLSPINPIPLQRPTFYTYIYTRLCDGEERDEPKLEREGRKRDR